MITPRLRFSLRSLLLLITAVGIGLTIYRRPWQETDAAGTFGPLAGFYGRTVSYRYDWQGNRVKHGVEQWFNVQGRVIYEGEYLDGSYVGFRRFRHDGELIEFVSQPQGALELGTRHLYQGSERVVVEWQPQGSDQMRLEWQSRSGDFLQSMVVERGSRRIVKWSGRPALEEAERLLAELPPAHRTAWLTKSSDWTAPQSPSYPSRPTLELRNHTYCRDIGQDRHLVLQVHDRTGEWCGSPMWLYPAKLLEPAEVEFDDLPFILVLLQRLTAEDYMLQVRYGLLAAVPIAKAYLSDDPACVSVVKFPPGSAEEKAWLESVEHDLSDRLRHEQVSELFLFTPIRVQVGAFAAFTHDQPNFGNRGARSPGLLRTRRDQLGSILWYAGLHIEQQGEELVVKK